MHSTSRHLVVLAHHGRRVLHFRVSGGAVTGMVTPAVGLEPMDPFDESVMHVRSSRHSSAPGDMDVDLAGDASPRSVTRTAPAGDRRAVPVAATVRSG